MDMVSLESQEEQNFIQGLMQASNVRFVNLVNLNLTNLTQVQNVHTAGRLCDAEVDGCNQTRFQPLSVNGWFWASTLRMMPPTNQVFNGRNQVNDPFNDPLMTF